MEIAPDDPVFLLRIIVSYGRNVLTDILPTRILSVWESTKSRNRNTLQPQDIGDGGASPTHDHSKQSQSTHPRFPRRYWEVCALRRQYVETT